VTQSNPWPIHPQPQYGESPSSWLARQAQSNGIPIRGFLSSCLGEGEWRRRDIDLLEGDKLALLAQLGLVQGGYEGLWNASLARWTKNIGASQNVDRKSWISSLWITRYCPTCLAQDEIPYLRTVWRLHFAPICLEHKTLILRACYRCGQTQRVLSFHSDSSSGICSSCGSPLAEAPEVEPSGCTRLETLTSKLPTILESNFLPLEYEWPYSAADFFSVLRFLMRYFNINAERLSKLNFEITVFGSTLPTTGGRTRQSLVSS